MTLFASSFQRKLPLYAQKALQLGGGITAFHPITLPAGEIIPTGLRDYTPGDDPRRIDWGICARHDELRVKEFRGKTVHHAYFLLDTSRSMHVGPQKFNLARESLMVLAYTLLRQHSSISVLCWDKNQSKNHILLSLSGVSRLGKLMKFLENTAITSQKTDFCQTAQDFTSFPFPKGSIFIISDFFGQTDSFEKNYTPGLIHLQEAGFFPHLIHITSCTDRGENMRGDVIIEDVESGYRQSITLTERDIRAYQKLYLRYVESIPTFCRRRKIRYTQVSTEMKQDEACLAALGIPHGTGIQ
ncbi:MAG: DUF58 domain-containing protein [Planctomycetia bacterium]|nr:DUF58 domain-containing protein [Planctomycetia bacterium]